MKIGVSGHQGRVGIDWRWVSRTTRTELMRIRGATRALSSLARGSDQVFAEAALNLKIPVVAVLPVYDYERYFDASTLADYRRLQTRCTVIQLGWKGNPERAFFEAGKFVVDHANILLAIWDGEPTKGLGGTADIVAYAATKNRKIVHIDPIRKLVRRF